MCNISIYFISSHRQISPSQHIKNREKNAIQKITQHRRSQNQSN